MLCKSRAAGCGSDDGCASADESVRRGDGVSQCGSFPGGGGRGWACTPRVRGRRAARVRAAAAARVGDGGSHGAYSEGRWMCVGLRVTKHSARSRLRSFSPCGRLGRSSDLRASGPSSFRFYSENWACTPFARLSAPSPRAQVDCGTGRSDGPLARDITETYPPEGCALDPLRVRARAPVAPLAYKPEHDILGRRSRGTATKPQL